MYQLSQIIRTLDDFKQVKVQVQATDRAVKEIEQWRHYQSQQQGKEIVLKSDLQLLIDMLKRETEVAMRTHFEIFQGNTESTLSRKVDSHELKQLLH
jgi:hypothetical protein